MPMSTEERSMRATRARVAKARTRRFTKYAEEMQAQPVPDVALDILSDVLRRYGYDVTAPNEPAF